MEVHGIDISRWQGKPDFDKVKTDPEARFVIIKAGGSDKGLYKDPQFERNYRECKARGIPVGTYYFVGPRFLTVADGVADAQRFLSIIKGKTFEYPVCLDLEATPPSKRREATDASIAFLEEIEKAGYYAMIYSSDVSGFMERLELDRLNGFDKWVARYNTAGPRNVKPGIWQRMSTMHITGITGNVDANIAYKDYPAIMKKAHLNGY